MSPVNVLPREVRFGHRGGTARSEITGHLKFALPSRLYRFPKQMVMKG
jgi:hypothetical protein